MEWDRGEDGIWIVGEGAAFELNTPVNACELGKKYWLELKEFEGHIDVEDKEDVFSGPAFDEPVDI